MNNTSDALARSVALEKALQFHGAHSCSDDEVVTTADKFLSFLIGETAKPEPFKLEEKLPTFTLPKLWDGYDYFQFNDSYILYRAAREGSEDRIEGVDRINTRVQAKWYPNNTVLSRRRLILLGDYHLIGPVTAAKIIKDNVRGVRFE
jgi:hypothetical protein